MENRNLLRSKVAITVIITLFFSLPSLAQEVELTVIGNAESVPNELTMRDLKSILRAERQKWEDGVSIKLALMKTGTHIGASTCKKIYGMTGNELNKYFLALVFQGKAKAPVFFNSVSEMETYVAQTPGAIGVLQTTTDTQLKTVLIDGNKQIQ